MTESIRRGEDRGQIRPEEGRGALLQDDRVVGLRFEARIDLDPAAPDLQLGKGRHLRRPDARVRHRRLEADGRVDDRESLRSRCVEQTLGRSDGLAQLGSEGAAGVGKAAAEVDDEHARPLSQAD
jgi:hypothetical protein